MSLLAHFHSLGPNVFIGPFLAEDEALVPFSHSFTFFLILSYLGLQWCTHAFYSTSLLVSILPRFWFFIRPMPLRKSLNRVEWKSSIYGSLPYTLGVMWDTTYGALASFGLFWGTHSYGTLLARKWILIHLWNIVRITYVLKYDHLLYINLYFFYQPSPLHCNDSPFLLIWSIK